MVQYSIIQCDTALFLSQQETEQGLRQKDIDKGQFYYNDIIMEAKFTNQGRLQGRKYNQVHNKGGRLCWLLPFEIFI